MTRDVNLPLSLATAVTVFFKLSQLMKSCRFKLLLPSDSGRSLVIEVGGLVENFLNNTREARNHFLWVLVFRLLPPFRIRFSSSSVSSGFSCSKDSLIEVSRS
jgi:hypothetical protein